jgi:hypothetical protein
MAMKRRLTSLKTVFSAAHAHGFRVIPCLCPAAGHSAQQIVGMLTGLAHFATG